MYEDESSTRELWKNPASDYSEYYDTIAKEIRDLMFTLNCTKIQILSGKSKPSQNLKNLKP